MADRFFLPRYLYSLLAGFLVISDVTMAMTSSLWNNVGENTVTSSVATSNTSRVVGQCVMECHQMESCVSVAFDPESDICYLQPTYRPARQGDDGPLDVYTREKVSECKPSEAPDVTNVHVSKWRMTPSSLNGDVSCDEDYVLSEDVTPQVHCQLDSGVWTTLMAASCKQSAWRNYTVKLNTPYPLPRPASVDLCVRVKGTPTGNYRFTIDLKTSGGDIVLHVNPRLRTDNYVKTTILDYKQGKDWSSTRVELGDPSPPFPFAVDVPFDMVITAASLYKFTVGFVIDMVITAASLYKFTVQVNGVLYGEMTGVLPVTAVTSVRAELAVSVQSIAVGC